MRFFTKGLWLSAQNPDKLKLYDEEWQRAFDGYRAQLDALRPRLSEDCYKFFAEADVHDGELLDLVLTDGSRPAPVSEPVRAWASSGDNPIRASLEVLDSYDKMIWRLAYKRVRRVVVDFPTEEPLFYSDGEGFGDWGYHELSDAGNNFFRHEILFATGAVVLFEFREVSVSCMPRQIARS